MRKLVTIIALYAMFIAFPASAATGAQHLHDFLAQVTTLRADFHQTVMDADQRIIQEASGTLAVLRPGRFRWDYRDPFIQVIVADGVRIWMYDEELGQVTVRPLDDTLASTPAMLLSGGDDIGTHSEVRELGEAGGLVWVGLLPKVRDSEFESVRLGFDGALIAVMELVDNFGQTTRIEFTHQVINSTIDVEVFEFIPPPGTDVIGAEH